MTLPVVGAPYINRDKSSRQFEILLCAPGDPLTLIHDAKNRYDEHAVAVFSERGVQIGYITAERSPHIVQLLRDGHELSAVFQAQTRWGAFARIGVDEPAILPKVKPLPKDGSDPDSGFYPDWLPPDD